MRICFTLDDVLRAKTKQFGKFFKKAKNPDINLDEIELNTDDMYELFGFENTKDYVKFLYEDYPFEIFGEAPVVDKMLDKNFNLWLLKFEDNDDETKYEISLSNPFEYNASIGYTCFFLSKIATRIREFYFPENSFDIWDKCDVLVTASTKLLNNKPEGKIAIKIDMPYNKDCESDFSYESLSELLNDNDFLKKINGENGREEDRQEEDSQ